MRARLRCGWGRGVGASGRRARSRGRRAVRARPRGGVPPRVRSGGRAPGPQPFARYPRRARQHPLPARRGAARPRRRLLCNEGVPRTQRDDPLQARRRGGLRRALGSRAPAWERQHAGRPARWVAVRRQYRLPRVCLRAGVDRHRRRGARVPGTRRRRGGGDGTRRARGRRCRAHRHVGSPAGARARGIRIRREGRLVGARRALASRRSRRCAGGRRAPGRRSRRQRDARRHLPARGRRRPRRPRRLPAPRLRVRPRVQPPVHQARAGGALARRPVRRRPCDARRPGEAVERPVFGRRAPRRGRARGPDDDARPPVVREPHRHARLRQDEDGARRRKASRLRFRRRRRPRVHALRGERRGAVRQAGGGGVPRARDLLHRRGSRPARRGGCLRRGRGNPRAQPVLSETERAGRPADARPRRR